LSPDALVVSRGWKWFNLGPVLMEERHLKVGAQ
jgi:hypothetical protein